MSIRPMNCPGCQIAVNVPTGMASVKCPSCGAIFNPNAPVAPVVPQAEAQEQPEDADTDATMGNAAIIAGVVGGAMMLIAMIGIMLVVINRPPDPELLAKKAPEETIKPAVPEEYREIALPEEHRRRIYNEYRMVARTTVEQPLVLPQGTRARASMEDMLQKTFDRELMRFAALHDITVDDVKEVIKEGDANGWDGRARSNAVRDGKRVYTKEMSEGYERKKYSK